MVPVPEIVLASKVKSTPGSLCSLPFNPDTYEVSINKFCPRYPYGILGKIVCIFY